MTSLSRPVRSRPTLPPPVTTKRSTVESCTPEEKAVLPFYAEWWTCQAMSVSEADWTAAEKALMECYDAVSIARPRFVIRSSSPANACVIGPVFEHWMRVAFNAGESPTVSPTVDTSAYKGVSLREISEIMMAYINDIMFGRVRANELPQAIREMPAGATRDLHVELFEFLKSADAKEACRVNWHQYRPLQGWSGWYGYYNFVRDVLGLDLPEWENYGKDERCALACHLVWYGYNCAVICDRPCTIKAEIVTGQGVVIDTWDSDKPDQSHDFMNMGNGRLHCEDGPACEFADGFKSWFIHGVQVTEQIVMRPETLTIDQIHGETNSEVQRIMIERFGVERYVMESASEIVDKRLNTKHNKYELLIRLTNGALRFVPVDPSTNRRYFIGVPKNAGITTCEQAQEYLGHGLESLAIHRS